MFAKRLEGFRSLRRKAVRVIQYRGLGRTETLKEYIASGGYACGFEALIGYINGLLPASEVIGQALRKSLPIFPELAVRELIANALIHQDFFVTGTGPMVEVFDDIAERNAAVASRLLNEAVEAGHISLQDPEVGTRVRQYIPFWAVGRQVQVA
jgi:hypothetical protein